MAPVVNDRDSRRSSLYCASQQNFAMPLVRCSFVCSREAKTLGKRHKDNALRLRDGFWTPGRGLLRARLMSRSDCQSELVLVRDGSFAGEAHNSGAALTIFFRLLRLDERRRRRTAPASPFAPQSRRYGQPSAVRAADRANMSGVRYMRWPPASSRAQLQTVTALAVCRHGLPGSRSLSMMSVAQAANPRPSATPGVPILG
jgi:hypothetical protein